MTIGAAQQFFLGASKATGGGAAGYQIERSLRFNSSDSAFCSRTPAVTGNRTTFTWSGWVKRTKVGSRDVLFSTEGSGGSSGYTAFQFTSADVLFFEPYIAVTSAVFRDLSAWYHIQLAVDTNQVSAANRVQFYVNGVLQSSSATSLGQGAPTEINGAANPHGIGAIRYAGTFSTYANIYLADIHFIDGQALTPSSFTEVSATTGQLLPRQYTGSFGTNGFWLKFSDNSAATAATLGKDYSGNSNNWTPNNLSVTAGAGNDSLVDTPTSYGTDTGVGGEVRGNYATLNPLDKTPSYGTLSNGNLDWAYSGQAVYAGTRSTIGVFTGKWYFECTNNGPPSAGFTYIGVATKGFNFDDTTNILILGNETRYYRSDGNKSTSNGSQTTAAYGASYTTGDVIGVALDLDAGTIAFYKNGATQGQAYSGLSGTYFSCGSSINNSAGLTWNFGQRAFAHPVSGFKALCDTNLPSPLIAKPNTVMDVVLYTGTGAALTPTSSLGFNPDWIWIKSRSAATDHALYDVVRGAQARLESNTTDAEVTTDGGVTAFNSAGFTLGTLAQVNTSSATYAAWCWDAGTSTVSNTAGSITSQVRANASAGFSVVTYTGNGSAGATIGHGLGVAPAFLIIKGRGHVSSWHCYHSAIGNTSAIFLSSTSASVANSVYWNNTSPGSTTFTVGISDGMNGNTNTYVAYCFSSVVGYSSFGSYTGNGSTDGPFVYTGFRPRWLMIKCSSIGDAYQHWHMFDTSRSPSNVSKERLRADSSGAEDSFAVIDLLSSGFKIRYTDGYFNQSASTWIYMAFAENPFQYARAR